MDQLNLHAGNPQGRERNEVDFYPTPPDVTAALLNWLKPEPMKIWEPACGEGDMVDVLKAFGHEVHATDLIQGVDFLDAPHVKCDAIITNPPFSLSQEFIVRALEIAPLVCMLVKSQYWHAASRQRLFATHRPAHVLPLTWRPDFLWKQRTPGGPSASPTMEVQWVVWCGPREETTYEPLPRPVAGWSQQSLDL